MFISNCPNCQKSMQVPSNYLNREIRCAECGSNFVAKSCTDQPARSREKETGNFLRGLVVIALVLSLIIGFGVWQNHRKDKKLDELRRETQKRMAAREQTLEEERRKEQILRSERLKQSTTNPQQVEPVFLGSWRVSGSPLIERITMNKTGDSYGVLFSMTDGSKLFKTAHKASAANGQKFTWGSPSGDYIILKDSGKLELRDQLGLVAMGRNKLVVP